MLYGVQEPNDCSLSALSYVNPLGDHLKAFWQRIFGSCLSFINMIQESFQYDTGKETHFLYRWCFRAQAEPGKGFGSRKVAQKDPKDKPRKRAGLTNEEVSTSELPLSSPNFEIWILAHDLLTNECISAEQAAILPSCVMEKHFKVACRPLKKR